MKAYIYINPNAPAEVKDLVAEHFSDVSRVSSVFMQEVTGGPAQPGRAGLRPPLERILTLVFLQEPHANERIACRREPAARLSRDYWLQEMEFTFLIKKDGRVCR